jgi:biopolymer transport protein ExbB/TolQ
VVYGVLGLLAIGGAYCAVLAWRRLASARFRSDQQQADFMNELQSRIAAGDMNSAKELCAEDRRVTPQLAAIALAETKTDPAKLRMKLVQQFDRAVLGELDYRLSWVGTVVKAAPMVGLLGTVMGMMGAFTQLAAGGQPETAQMAEDIGFALVTTASGLGIAIPLVLCTAAIQARLRKLEESVNIAVHDLVEVSGRAKSPKRGGLVDA